MSNDQIGKFSNWRIDKGPNIDPYQNSFVRAGHTKTRDPPSVFEFKDDGRLTRCYFTPYPRENVPNRDCFMIKDFGVNTPNFDIIVSLTYHLRYTYAGSSAGGQSAAFYFKFGRERPIQLLRQVDKWYKSNAFKVSFFSKSLSLPIGNPYLHDDESRDNWVDEEYDFKVSVRTNPREDFSMLALFYRKKGDDEYDLINLQKITDRSIFLNKEPSHRIYFGGRYWNPLRSYMDVRNLRICEYETYQRDLLYSGNSRIFFDNIIDETRNENTPRKVLLMKMLEGTSCKDFLPLEDGRTEFQRIGESRRGNHYGVHGQVFEARLAKDEKREFPLVMKVVYIDGKIDSNAIYKTYVENEFVDTIQLPLHDNICHILHHFVEEVDVKLFPTFDNNVKSAFFVMEKYEQNLSQYTRSVESKISEVEFLTMMKDLLVGVHHMNKNFIVHRDLKMDNVFLSREGGLVISDFGCHTNLIDSHSFVVQSDDPTYIRGGADICLPPEIRNPAITNKFDYRKVDVFGVGIISFALLSEDHEYPDIEGEGVDDLKELLVGLEEFSCKKKLEKLIVENILKADLRRRYTTKRVLKEVMNMIPKDDSKKVGLERVEFLRSKQRRIARYFSNLELINLYRLDHSLCYREEYFVGMEHRIHEARFTDSGRILPYEDLCFRSLEERDTVFETIVCDLEKDKVLKNEKKNWIKRSEKWKNVRKSLKRSKKGELPEDARRFVKSLIEEVSVFFGGFEKKDIEDDCKKRILEEKEKSGRNVVYLGSMEGCGLCRHRSILFKAMCDFIGIRCCLMRGWIIPPKISAKIGEHESKSEGGVETEGEVQGEERNQHMVDLSEKLRREDTQSESTRKPFAHVWNIIELGGVLYLVDSMNEKDVLEMDEGFKPMNQGEVYKNKNEKVLVDFIKQEFLRTRTSMKPLFSSAGGLFSLYSLEFCDEVLPFLNLPNFFQRTDPKEEEKMGKTKFSLKEMNLDPSMVVTIENEPIEFKDTEKIKKYVAREVKFMNFLRHPNIVRSYGTFEVENENKIFIVMDHFNMNGYDFIDRAEKELKNVEKLGSIQSVDEKKRKLRHIITEVLVYLIEVAEGVLFLHSVDVVHNGLHPGTIFVEWDEKNLEVRKVCISDFIASKENTDHSITSSSSKVRTKYNLDVRKIIESNRRNEKVKKLTDFIHSRKFFDMSNERKGRLLTQMVNTKEEDDGEESSAIRGADFAPVLDIYSFGRIMNDFKPFYREYPDLVELQRLCCEKDYSRGKSFMETVISKLRRRLNYFWNIDSRTIVPSGSSVKGEGEEDGITDRSEKKALGLLSNWTKHPDFVLKNEISFDPEQTRNNSKFARSTILSYQPPPKEIYILEPFDEEEDEGEIEEKEDVYKKLERKNMEVTKREREVIEKITKREDFFQKRLFPEVLSSLGHNAMKESDFGKASKYFDWSIQADDKNFVPFLHRGTCRVKLGKFREAIEDFGKSLEIEKNVFGYYYRGICHEHLKGYDEAIEDYRSTLSLVHGLKSTGKVTKRISAYSPIGIDVVYFRLIKVYLAKGTKEDCKRAIVVEKEWEDFSRSKEKQVEDVVDEKQK